MHCQAWCRRGGFADLQAMLQRVQWQEKSLSSFGSCQRLCVLLQVTLVCHGMTEVVPDKDGSDPYEVSY